MDPSAYEQMDRIEERHWWYVGRRAIVAHLLKQLDLPDNARLLEVGCGTGGNLAMLRAFGHVSAVEMNPDALARARKKAGETVDLHLGGCPAPFPDFDKPFDAIFLFDVLEHIENDVEALRFFVSKLASDGRLVLTVPAFKALWGPHDTFHHHKRRYSPRALRTCMIEAGFTVERISCFNTLLFPAAVLARWMDRIRGARQSTGLALPPHPVNSLLSTVFGAERWPLGWGLNFPWGLSIWAVGTVQ